MHLTEDIIKENPNLATLYAPSFNTRQEILVTEVPKLGKEAALKAIEEWGQPVSAITHLIFCTSSGIEMPGADFRLTKLLGLKNSVQRLMIYQQGCAAAGTSLRIAKDIAENNAGARVLIVCCDSMLPYFHAPSEEFVDVLVANAIFSDGAAALIVGANPNTKIERPLFQLVSTAQTIIPDSDIAVVGHVREMGMQCYLSKGVHKFIADNIVQLCAETFNHFGVTDWNSLFYAVHPGGPVVLNAVEERLGLKKEKMRASRHVLSEYGNMGCGSVLFALDEMRKTSIKEGKSTTGDGLELGVLLACGPGITVETVVLRSVAN